MRVKSYQIGVAFLLLTALIAEPVLASYGGTPQTLSGKISLLIFQKYFYTTLFLYFIPMVASISLMLMYKNKNKILLLLITLFSTCALLVLIPQLKDYFWGLSLTTNERIVKTLIFYLIYTYIAAVQLYAVYFATKTKLVLSIAKGAAYSGLLIIISILVLFWKFTGHATGYSDYELVLIYSLAIVSIMIWLDYKYKCEIIGAYALPCIILGLAKETTHVFRIDTTVTLFQNNWCFLPFVITHSLGSAFFAISLGISVMYLLALRNERDITEKLLLVAPLPSAELLNGLLYTIIKIGFLFLTLSIIMRAVWVTSTWGFEWGTIWPYATWMLYAILMMYRASNKQKANLYAWGAILCFFVSMHNFVGYHDFLRGL
ncbi:MAG: hypothetical protein JJE30_19435 [Desulfuromonadales bacterium]|nr:hypothetical protein [Desulfuromonadales bacterium]